MPPKALRMAAAGQELIKGLPPLKSNLVAAIWYAEWAETEATPGEADEHLVARQKWLDTVRCALPSCFCDLDEFA